VHRTLQEDASAWLVKNKKEKREEKLRGRRRHKLAVKNLVAAGWFCGVGGWLLKWLLCYEGECDDDYSDFVISVFVGFKEARQFLHTFRFKTNG
jgi:hypothetical protein